MRMNIEYIETQEVNEVDNVNGIHNLLLLQNKVNISGPGWAQEGRAILKVRKLFPQSLSLSDIFMCVCIHDIRKVLWNLWFSHLEKVEDINKKL